MDMVTRGWLIYSMTNSALHLAMVTAIRAFPLLIFGLLVGVLADRFDRKKLLMFSQVLNLMVNVIMGGLILLDWLEIWMVYATSVLAGIGMSIQSPARNAMIPATVPKAALQNAVVLNSSTLNIGQTVGPALGGFLIARMGMASTFIVQAVLFLISMVMTQRLNIVSIPPKRMKDESISRSLLEGFRYVRRKRVLLALLLLIMVPMFFGTPIQSVIPIFAEDILQIGAEGAGVLLGSMGAGTVMSTLILMFSPTFSRTGRIVFVAITCYGFFLLMFSHSTFYLLSVLLMFLAGICLSLFRALSQSMIIRTTDNEFLGRVNSIYMLDRGLVPLGTVVLGLLVDYTQVTFAVSMMSSLCIILPLITLLMPISLWRVERKTS